MAAAATIQERGIQPADWELWEAELQDQIPGTDWDAVYLNETAPENETYGRSLSSIRALGAYALNHTLAETITSAEAAQAKVEFYTSVEEGFGTDMELGGGLEVRDFDLRPVRDGRVMSKDLSRAVSSMTEAGLACAVETAKHDPRFLPQLVRSEWDHNNALIVDQMARGETSYNTRIVVSPFPLEGASQSGEAFWRDIGYVPHLRRGFVQLYHITENGVLAGSLSFDGTDKNRLRELFAELGVHVPEGEITDNWLKYAITDNLSEADAKRVSVALADRAGDPRYEKNTNTVAVTKQYKNIMERVFNESYIHICESYYRGQQTQETQELVQRLAHRAHDFNEHYRNALYKMRANAGRFTSDDSVVLHELLVYATIEMMRALHLKETSLYQQSMGGASGMGTEQVAAYLQMTSLASFQDMLSSAGANGAKNNRTYSACGLSISLGGKGLGGDLLDPLQSQYAEEEDGPQSAFGGHGGHLITDEDKLGNRYFTCPKGHVNYRRRANIKERSCTTCRIDISCEAPKPRKKEKVTEALSRVLIAASNNDKNSQKPKRPELAASVA